MKKLKYLKMVKNKLKIKRAEILIYVRKHDSQ